jgi:hypothetical protein
VSRFFYFTTQGVSYEAILPIFSGVRIGLSSGNIPNGTLIGVCPNSYAISFCFNTACYLTGELHRFQLPEGAIRPEIKENRNVYGCGLVLDPENNLTIFFTVNGKLLGEFCLKERIGDEWTDILNS